MLAQLDKGGPGTNWFKLWGRIYCSVSETAGAILPVSV